jgi:hypothetical protein
MLCHLVTVSSCLYVSVTHSAKGNTRSKSETAGQHRHRVVVSGKTVGRGLVRRHRHGVVVSWCRGVVVSWRHGVMLSLSVMVSSPASSNAFLHCHPLSRFVLLSRR